MGVMSKYFLRKDHLVAMSRTYRISIDQVLMDRTLTIRDLGLPDSLP
jgi:hypothetical protein